MVSTPCEVRMSNVVDACCPGVAPPGKLGVVYIGGLRVA